MRPMNIKRLLPLLGLLLLCWQPAGLAQGGGEPIYLDADTAEVDNITGISVYTGNVIMTQGERRVTGDRMTVHTRDNQELEKIIVEGRPAVWTEQPGNGGDLLQGEAPRMEYYAAGPERVVLLQGGKVIRGRNTVTGETIEYNLETEVARARGKDSEERIRITLFPDDQ